MKNFKLLCLFLVILFVSTEGAPRGGRGGGRSGGGRGGGRSRSGGRIGGFGGGRGGFSGGSGGGGEGISATEVIIIVVVISVVVIVITCICHVYWIRLHRSYQSNNCNGKKCEEATNEYDQQTLASSQIPQGNTANSPSQNIQMAVIPVNGISNNGTYLLASDDVRWIRTFDDCYPTQDI